MGSGRRIGGWVDRVGGRLYYRFIGLLVAVIALGSGFAAWQVLTGPDATAGDRTAGIVFGVLSGLLGRLAIWCFSPDRRLSDME